MSHLVRRHLSPELCQLLKRVRMEKMSGADLHMETSEGGLKELVMRWFTETQAPQILSDGNFPDWFQGFTPRKDTEDLLRDKALGCFLVRLSDKAIGYILSYKGRDRCRHFVITQNEDGQYMITGDRQTYNSLTELIEFYKFSPIQPFGEYLTSCCYEVDGGELYDVVNYSNNGNSGVNVQALRVLWDQKNGRIIEPSSKQRVQQLNDPQMVQPPALPPKSRNRKLTGTVSIDTVSLSQVVPPVPKRGLPLSITLSESLPSASEPSEAQTDPNRSQKLRGITHPVLISGRDSSADTDTRKLGDLCPVGMRSTKHTQLENRRSPLGMNSNMEEEKEEEEEEEEFSSHSFISSAYSPSSLKKVTCHTYSLHDPGWSSSRSEHLADGAEMLRSNPLYQASEGAGGSLTQQGGGTYPEVPQKPTSAKLPDDTYEQIPGEPVQGNTYESLEEMKTKKSKSTWGRNNTKWMKFLPDYMKK